MAGSIASIAWCWSVAAQEVARDIEPTNTAGYASWAGLYGGIAASAGNSYGRYEIDGFRAGGVGIAGLTSGFGAARNETSVLGGGFAGYNWQSERVVFGLEASGGAATFKRGVAPEAAGLAPGTGDLFAIKRDAQGAVRGRVGFSFDNFLVYATSGLALADQRVVGSGLSAAPSETAGYTWGFGLDAAIAPNWALGVDYARSQFAARNGPPGLDLPVLPRVRATNDDVQLRLTWFPDGIGRVPEPAEDKAEGQADWSLHGQTTLIQQGTPRFRSPYVGAASFVPSQARETWTLTGYFGRRLWDGAEVYFNPELDQGFGLSRTLGIAGYVNGEAQKAGAPYPKFRPQRYFLRQVFGLGGETETVADGLNQIAGSRDVDRITITVGRIAVGDIFDDNAYAHDPRLNFNNWALWESAAYDFPANLPGYTQGIVAELNRKEWAVRAGFFQVPKYPNNDVLDPRIDRKGGAVIEVEQRYDLWEQPGKLRLGAFSNVGRTASYQGALLLADAIPGTDPNDAADATQRGRRKSGVYGNIEQAITDQLGFFLRASYNDGRTQILSFTDIDRSLSGGFALQGAGWDRPKDTIGIGATGNFLSAPHRDFLAAGGLGLLIGDGRLNYAPEHALEAYYKLNLARTVDLTFDYQLVANPGYNADRGPVNVFALRLHAEF